MSIKKLKIEEGFMAFYDPELFAKLRRSWLAHKGQIDSGGLSDNGADRVGYNPAVQLGDPKYDNLDIILKFQASHQLAEEAITKLAIGEKAVYLRNISLLKPRDQNEAYMLSLKIHASQLKNEAKIAKGDKDIEEIVSFVDAYKVYLQQEWEEDREKAINGTLNLKEKEY